MVPDAGAPPVAVSPPLHRATGAGERSAGCAADTAAAQGLREGGGVENELDRCNHSSAVEPHAVCGVPKRLDVLLQQCHAVGNRAATASSSSDQRRRSSSDLISTTPWPKPPLFGFISRGKAAPARAGGGRRVHGRAPLVAVGSGLQRDGDTAHGAAR